MYLTLLLCKFVKITWATQGVVSLCKIHLTFCFSYTLLMFCFSILLSYNAGEGFGFYETLIALCWVCSQNIINPFVLHCMHWKRHLKIYLYCTSELTYLQILWKSQTGTDTRTQTQTQEKEVREAGKWWRGREGRREGGRERGCERVGRGRGRDIGTEEWISVLLTTKFHCLFNLIFWSIFQNLRLVFLNK